MWFALLLFVSLTRLLDRGLVPVSLIVVVGLVALIAVGPDDRLGRGRSCLALACIASLAGWLDRFRGSGSSSARTGAPRD